jgi:hypothetical protein
MDLSQMILIGHLYPLTVAYLGQFTRRSFKLRMPDAVPVTHEAREFYVGPWPREPRFHVEPAPQPEPFWP